MRKSCVLVRYGKLCGVSDCHVLEIDLFAAHIEDALHALILVRSYECKHRRRTIQEFDFAETEGGTVATRSEEFAGEGERRLGVLLLERDSLRTMIG